MTETSIRKVLVIPDVHLPYEDKAAVAAMMRYVKQNRPWKKTILLGDLIDFDCISSHNAGNLRAVEGKTLAKDYGAARKFLDDLIVALGFEFGEVGDIIYLQGNHEYRVERYINANPQMKGIVEVERVLQLKERGIKWIKSWQNGELYRIGKATFTHGLYHNEHHAKSMVLAFEQNVFYGHIHDVMAYPKKAYGDNNTKIAQSLGCLCDYKQSYLKGQPTKWQHAFGIFYFWPDGKFNYYIPFIFNGQFVGPDGKVYKG